LGDGGKSKKSRRHLPTLVRVGVVCAAVILGVRWAREPRTWADLVETFRRMDLRYFALALGIFAVGQVLVGFRWWLLLRSQQVHIAVWSAVKLHYLGLFYNNFMPSSVGGDFVRAWYVTKHHHRRFEAALSVFVDRAIGLASTFVIAGFFYGVFLRGRGIAGEISAGGGGLGGVIAGHKWIIFGVVGAGCLAVAGVAATKRGRTAIANIRSRAVYVAKKGLGRLRTAAVMYCKRPFTIAAAFLLTVCMQLTTITAFWLLGRNLGIEASVKYYYVFFTLTWVLGAVPVSIGGAGVVEGSLYYLFTTFAAAAKAPAMGIVLCQRAVWMLASLPGAVIHIAGAHLPKDFAVDEERQRQ